MKTKKTLGYDMYLIQCNDIMPYLNIFSKMKINIYFLKKVDTYTYQFCVKRKGSYQLRRLDLPIVFEKSVGLLYYITLFFKSRIKLVGIMTFIIVYLLLNNCILNLKVVGTKYQLNQQIVQKLKEYDVHFLNQKLDYEQLEQLKIKLQTDFKEDIDWLNIYQKGQTFFVEYTNKKESSITSKDNRPIVACKDSVIKQFQIHSGYISVNVNQFVKAGELLVSNTLVSTFDETILLYPSGKIYGYTWYDIEKSIPKIDDEGEAFSELLKQVRDELEKLTKNEFTIDQEKVLQFSINDSKIVMKVHYTLIENIACKGEINESYNQTD